MSLLASVLALVVAVEHVAFMALEMFFWTSPIGLRAFGQTAEAAQQSKALAANQGLYNGFLALGLALAVFGEQLEATLYCLACVVVAGIFGALTAKPRIFLVQSVPALAAIAAMLLLDRG